MDCFAFGSQWQWAACNDPNSCHCEERSDVAIHISDSAGLKMDCFAFGSQWLQFMSLRGAKRRGNPYFMWCKTKDGLLRLRLAMTVGGSQWPQFPSLRGAKRRGNQPQPRHCEEQSDVAIHISDSAGLKMDCFACGSQWQWAARNDSNLCHCEEQSDVANYTNPVIARSKATWQSIFRWCKTTDGLLRLRLAMTVGGSQWPQFPSLRGV